MFPGFSNSSRRWTNEEAGISWMEQCQEQIHLRQVKILYVDFPMLDRICIPDFSFSFLHTFTQFFASWLSSTPNKSSSGRKIVIHHSLPENGSGTFVCNLQTLTFTEYYGAVDLDFRNSEGRIDKNNVHPLGVCKYRINLGTRCSGRVVYPSGRIFVIPRNNRVPEMITYSAATSDTRINRISELIGYATITGWLTK